jgi:hypothetical protein
MFSGAIFDGRPAGNNLESASSALWAGPVVSTKPPDLPFEPPDLTSEPPDLRSSGLAGLAEVDAP